jgi:hypothetical protein
MLRLDRLSGGTERPDPLLLAVCALAGSATRQSQQLQDMSFTWASDALSRCLTDAHQISVNNLMCIVLLHEYYVRRDDLKQCFILSAIACRLCQALQLNVEFDEDYDCTTSSLSATEKETRRRIMWACYAIDSSTSGGLDSLKMLRESDVTIQMPSDEDKFYFRTAGKTSFIRPIGRLGQSDEDLDVSISLNPSTVLGGYRAYFVHLIILRERILRYLKRPTEEQYPSEPNSEFSRLRSDLARWEQSLPQDLRLSPEIIYIRKSQNMLPALLDIHTGYHQCGNRSHARSTSLYWIANNSTQGAICTGQWYQNCSFPRRSRTT